MSESLQALILACRQAFDAGEYALALAISRQLSALAPDRAESWRVQAEALVGLDRSSEALHPYAMAVARAPADGRLRVRQARALAACGLHQQAERSFAAAVALDPALLSAVHGLIGYRRLDPVDPCLDTVRAIAAGAPASPGSRAFACFLLGRILSGAGQDAEAFTFYAEANRLTHHSLRASPAERGPQQFRQWWHRHGRQALQTDQRAVAPRPCPAVLVCGLPRSGKSLVEHLISGHPELAAGEEFGGLLELVDGCVTDDGAAADPAARLQALQATPERLAECYSEALQAAAKPTAQRLIDTAPGNLWDLGYLAALHPEVPLILCRRDPLDLGVAIFFKKFSSGHAYSYDQATLGRRLALADHAIALWPQWLPNPLQVVEYEELVSDPEAIRNRLLRGLGCDPAACPPLPSSPSPGGGAATLHPSHSATGYGAIRPDLIGVGRRYARWMQPLLEAYDHSREAWRRGEAQETGPG
ncbi:MAG: sulfotransferase [Cyanobium sp.]